MLLNFLKFEYSLSKDLNSAFLQGKESTGTFAKYPKKPSKPSVLLTEQDEEVRSRRNYRQGKESAGTYAKYPKKPSKPSVILA